MLSEVPASAFPCVGGLSSELPQPRVRTQASRGVQASRTDFIEPKLALAAEKWRNGGTGARAIGALSSRKLPPVGTRGRVHPHPLRSSQLPVSSTDPTPALLEAVGDNALDAMRLLVAGVRSAASGGQRVALPLGAWASTATLHRHVSALVLRLLFVLYAEHNGLLPGGDAVYRERYGLSRDAAMPAVTWDRVVTLLGVLCGTLRGKTDVRLPRWGAWLFSADAGDPFLPSARGRAHLVIDDRAIGSALDVLSQVDESPVLFERLQVEHVAGVYERLFGYEVMVCEGCAVALEPEGAVVDVEALLKRAGSERAAVLEGRAGWRPPRRMVQRLEAADTGEALVEALAPRLLRGQAQTMAPGTLALQPTGDRRRFGAHYTPALLARQVVSAVLRPWIAAETLTEASLLDLTVCDPAMGTGVFLVEACRQLADALVRIRRGGSVALKDDEVVRARFDVAKSCLYGVDLDPLAVATAGTCLQLFAAGPRGALPSLASRLAAGDAVVGLGRWPLAEPVPGSFDDPVDHEGPWRVPTRSASTFAGAWTASVFESVAHARPRQELERIRARLRAGNEGTIASMARSLADTHGVRPLHWGLTFPEVFDEERGGFDAMVGNPPWVAYAGRAAQPLNRARFAYFLNASDAFRGYRTLHGLFVHRCASLLRVGGRLGLIVPTSLADLGGYAPVRRAHDALCVADEELPDFGSDAFEGVFQPAMALLSTRRDGASNQPEVAWPLARDDLDPRARDLLERLSRLPTLPGVMFAERGFQSTGEDAARIRATLVAEPPFVVPIREGADIRPFAAMPPRHHLDPSGLRGRFRRDEVWKEVGVLVRQTARYPMAAPADGIAFRNSILAGFGHGEIGVHALLAYLNTTPIRWFHYMRHRDARQGMPQVKIGHLRSLPAPPAEASRALACLNEIGEALANRNDGVRASEQEAIDEAVAEALSIASADLAMMRAWYERLAPPNSTS